MEGVVLWEYCVHACMRQKVQSYLVPRAENDYRPHALQRVSVAIMLVLVLATFAVANVQSLIWMSSEWLVSTVLPAIIVELTNEEREEESLRTLTRNPLLDEAAQLKAEDMAAKEYFAHTSPDGVTPWYWFDEAGYNFIRAGENLAVHFTESDDVVAAWMDSPGHRDNILGDGYTEIGVGTAKGEYKGFPTVFVVQLFGTPAGAVRTVSAAPVSVSVDTSPTTESISTPLEQSVTVASAQQNAAAEVEEDLTVTTTDTSVVVQSDLATTSRQGVVPAADSNIPAQTETVTSQQTSPTTFERIALNPSTLLQIVYTILGLFVLSLLVLSIGIEWRRQHPVQIAYGFGLMASMFILFYVHALVTSNILII